MNILSLFDGISAGQVVLNNLNYKINNYYSSEIDKSAIKVTQYNYPKTIQLGDIKNWKEWQIDFSKIDVLFAGFPCQSFSIVGNKLGFKDERGKLFFYASNILKEIKRLNPNLIFLFENVQMKKDLIDIISKNLEIDAVEIDSSNFSPQIRKRIYWTNLKIDNIIPNCNLILNDILDNNGNFEYYQNEYEFLGEDKPVCAKLNINGHDFIKRVCSRYHKCQTLTAVCGGSQEKKVYIEGKIRKLTPEEYEKLMGFPVGYTNIVSKIHRYKTLGNSWQINTIEWILKNLKYDIYR